MPLGTGNDLSRVLDWGKENEPEFNVEDVLAKIEKAKLIEIDRYNKRFNVYLNVLKLGFIFSWKIEISVTKHLGLRIPNKTLYMYNYMSVGVDAQVALDFHRTRESMSFSNRIFNKVFIR